MYIDGRQPFVTREAFRNCVFAIWTQLDQPPLVNVCDQTTTRLANTTERAHGFHEPIVQSRVQTRPFAICQSVARAPLDQDFGCDEVDDLFFAVAELFFERPHRVVAEGAATTSGSRLRAGIAHVGTLDQNVAVLGMRHPTEMFAMGELWVSDTLSRSLYHMRTYGQETLARHSRCMPYGPAGLRSGQPVRSCRRTGT